MNIRDLSNDLSNQYKILEGRCGIWARRCFCEKDRSLLIRPIHMADESAIRVYKRTLLCITIITINTK